MNEAYSAIERIWNRHVSGNGLDIKREILGLLLQQGIKTRQNDGKPKQINISNPTSIQDAFVVGLRYIKNDGTQSEDHFLCRKGVAPNTTRLEIEPHYKRRLEIELPEYRGTHKQQVVFATTNINNSYITQVNTITFPKEEK